MLDSAFKRFLASCSCLVELYLEAWLLGGMVETAQAGSTKFARTNAQTATEDRLAARMPLSGGATAGEGEIEER